jgi:hypothetical protein
VENKQLGEGTSDVYLLTVPRIELWDVTFRFSLFDMFDSVHTHSLQHIIALFPKKKKPNRKKNCDFDRDSESFASTWKKKPNIFESGFKNRKVNRSSGNTQTRENYLPFR